MQAAEPLKKEKKKKKRGGTTTILLTTSSRATKLPVPHRDHLSGPIDLDPEHVKPENLARYLADFLPQGI
jgi:hypothetical protein